MPFLDPDTLQLGATPETSPVAQMPMNLGGFLDPDSLPSAAENNSGGFSGSLVKQGKKMVQDVGGVAQAGMDLVGSLPAFAYGAPGFVDEVIKHKNPQEAFDTLMKFASDHNLLNLLPKDLTSLRDTEGYDVANKTLADSLKIFGQGAGNIAGGIANLAGAKDPSQVGEYADVGTQLGIMAGGTVKGLKSPKKGTTEWYTAQREMASKGGFLDPDTLQNTRDSYESKLEAEPPQPSARDRSESDYLYNPEQGVTSPFVERAGIKEIPGDYPGGKVIDPDAFERPQGTSSMDAAQTSANLREPEYAGSTQRGEIPDNGIDFESSSIPKGGEDNGQVLGAPKTVDPKEAELVTRAKAGDQKAFGELVETHRDRLVRVLQRYVRGDMAEDVAQEAFIHAYKGIQNFKGDSKFFTWLYRIAQNDAKNYFAKNDRTPHNTEVPVEEGLDELDHRKEEGVDNTTPEGTLSSKQMAERFDQVMEQLPPELRQILHMREIEGLSYEDISAMTNQPVGTIQSRLFRAREIMKERLKQYGYREGKKKVDPESYGAPKRLDSGDLFNPELDDILRNNRLNSNGQPRQLGDSTVRNGLRAVAESSEAPYFRELAKKLLQDEEFRPAMDVQKDLQHPQSKEGLSGMYRPWSHKIIMDLDHTGDERSFLHEGIHARLYAAIELFRRNKLNEAHPAYEPMKAISNLYHSFKKTSDYGMTDLHEFASEGLTNPEFMTELNSTPLPKQLRKGPMQSYWDAFVRHVSRLLGFKGVEAETYLSSLIQESSRLMDALDRKDRLYYYGDPSVESTSLGAQALTADKYIESSIDKKGLMGAVHDQVRDFKLDRRQFDEFYKEDMDGKPIQDFTPKSDNLAKRVYDRLGSLTKREFLQDTTIAILMKNVPGTGKLIKWTVDQVSRIDRDHLIKTKEALDEGLKDFRRMFRTDLKGLGQMRDKWVENIGKRDLTREDFRNEKQWKVYDAMQKVYSDILKQVNAMRATAGFKAIERIPSYFHSMWEGDYRVFGYDAAGEKVWASGAKTEVGANLTMKQLKERHPDLKWEQTEVQRAKGKEDLSDLSAFDEAIRVMEKDSPVTKAIQKTYQEILQHRGFGKTGLHRRGVLGFLGMQGDIRDMERSFTQYVEQAHRYMGNMEKQKVRADIAKMPKEVSDQIPQAIDFLNSYIHKARGGRGLTDWETKTLDALGSALGLGMNAPRNFVHGMSQVVYMYWLTTPRFLASQTVQSINAIPKLIQEHGTFDGLKMFYDGWANTIKPDSIAKEATDWASKRQYLDPTIRNLMRDHVHIEWKGRPTGFEGLREVMSWPAAWTEHNLVRAPVFLMFEKALRDSVKDKEERFEIAAQKADYYMVNYNRVHAPAVYDNLGIAGEMLRPLKMYSHNYIGQFLEYVQGAKNGKEYAPLAAFFGTQAAVAGLKGTMLVAEATIAVNLINQVFGTSINTPEQMLMKSNLHDLLVFGGLSTVLGRDVSSSVAAPGLPSMLNFPAVEFTWDMMHDVGNYSIQYMKGQETDQDRLRAWLAITPSASHEYLRNLYTPQGQPTSNPFDPQMRGNYRRDDYERLISSASGTKNLDESRADALVRNVRKELLRDADRKLDAVDAITDRIKGGQPVDADLFKRYMQNGGDPKQLSNNVASRMKQRMMTGVERMQDNQVTPQQAHRLGVMQQYLDNSSPLNYDKTGQIQPE